MNHKARQKRLDGRGGRQMRGARVQLVIIIFIDFHIFQLELVCPAINAEQICS
jgi:hypothetical protein